MYCHACGNELNKNDQACSKCGEKIKSSNKKENDTENKNINELFKGSYSIGEYEGNKSSDIIKNVFQSTDEVLEIIRNNLENEGLVCSQQEKGTGNYEVTGDAIGSRKEEIKEKSWNPFIVQLKETDYQAVQIELEETASITKENKGSVYNIKNYRLIKTPTIDSGMSCIGCFFSIPFLILTFILIKDIFSTGPMISADSDTKTFILFIISIPVVFSIIFYFVGKGISERMAKRKKPVYDEIMDKIDKGLLNAYNEIINE